MSRDTIRLPRDAYRLLQTLRAAGHSAYVVGGCVRDSLLGRTPGDWDICTSARPEEMRRLFADHQLILTGEKHGTVAVILHGKPYEITTYRLDGSYRDHRHPDSVQFVDDLAADLARRDFTVNAMAYAPGKGIIDLYGGRDDLAAGMIRCVGDPAQRFAEDALRILRALRFDTAGRTRITQLIRYHDLPVAPEPKPIRRLMNKLGVDAVRQLFALHIADTCGQSAICAGRVETYRQAEQVLDALLETDACFSLRDLAVNGGDMLALGLRGRAVGAALQACLDAVMEEAVANDKTALLTYAAENLQRFANS